MKNIKVYKMNDYEWWASKLDKRETLDFYLKEMGMDEEDNPIEDIEEINIDEKGMWYETHDEEDLERLGDNDESIHYEDTPRGKARIPKFGDLWRIGGSVFKFISYREAIEKNGEYKKPYMIACAEW